MSTKHTYPRLRAYCEMFEARLASRIAQANRRESMDMTLPTRFLKAEKAEEAYLARQMIAEYRKVAPPGVIAWQEETLGIGAHTLARLLGHLGHPIHAEPRFWQEATSGEHGDAANPKRALQDGEPFDRTLGQLWQYCGHGRALRRKAGMSQEEAFALGNPKCKMIVHLLADGVRRPQVCKLDENTREALGELGEFVLAEKLKYADRVHPGPCSGGYVKAGNKVVFARCKVEGGGYALAGDPYSPGHVDSIAMRHLGKEILRGLYEAARD